MPDFGSPKNPVDITGGAGVAGYEGAIEVALKSDWVHGVALLYCETAVTKPVDIAKGMLRAIGKVPNHGKSIVACFVGGSECVAAGELFNEQSIPMFDDPAKTMSAFGALRQAAQFEDSCSGDPDPFKDVDSKRAREIIAAARKEGRSALTEPEAKAVFTAYGLPVAPGRVARTEDEACALAKEIGYPVVMKIVSPEILHKSDAGGVKVNVKTETDVRTAFKGIMANAGPTTRRRTSRASWWPRWPRSGAR